MATKPGLGGYILKLMFKNDIIPTIIQMLDDIRRAKALRNMTGGGEIVSDAEGAYGYVKLGSS